MLDLFHIAKPQGCDIQIFYGVGKTASSNIRYSWTKPRGVSHIYIMCIGAGGNGDAAGAGGGGSGAVTVWYGAAQHVPDALVPFVGPTSSAVNAKLLPTGSGFATLIEAAAGSGTVGGSASTGGSAFVASGFFKSVAGQNGSTSGNPGASTTTFLSGGSNNADTVTANYGYNTKNTAGFFQMQPILVGCGGASGDVSTLGNGGIGCGGGSTSLGGSGGGTGGPGMVLIASW